MELAYMVMVFNPNTFESRYDNIIFLDRKKATEYKEKQISAGFLARVENLKLIK